MLGSNDIERSRRFYDALMNEMGDAPGQVDPWGRLVYVHDGARLLLTLPIDGAPATGANGGTIGFLMRASQRGSLACGGRARRRHVDRGSAGPASIAARSGVPRIFT